MNQLQRALFLFFCFFFTLSCSFKQPPPVQAQKVPVPDWFLQAYEPQDGYIYGVGSSANLARAKEKALREIAAKIEVSIKSNTQTTTRKRNTTISQTFEEKINATVQEFTFSHAEVNQQANIEGEYYLRMRVSLDSIIQTTTKKIEQLKSKLDRVFSDAENKTKLEQLFLLKANEDGLNEAILLTNRLDSLYQIAPFKPVNSIPIDQYLEHFDRQQIRLTNLTFSIFINIKVEKQFNKFAFVISNHLTESGIKNEINSNNRSEAELDIAVQLEKSKIFDDFLVKAKVIFLLKDDTNRAFQNKVISVKAFSPLSHENALVGLETRFDKMLKQEGILTILGI